MQAGAVRQSTQKEDRMFTTTQLPHWVYLLGVPQLHKFIGSFFRLVELKFFNYKYLKEKIKLGFVYVHKSRGCHL